MDTLTFIAHKYSLNLDARSPIEIANMGRNDLAALFAELDFTVGAEIGVMRGLYSEVLLKANPGLKLYCIDPYTEYEDYTDISGKWKHDKYQQEAAERLGAFNVKFLRKFSMEAVQKFSDNSLDFVYIDANHEFPYVVEDIHHWLKKVRKGGIIAGHDYLARKGSGYQLSVIPAVNGYTAVYGICPWFLVGTKAKVVGQVRDKSRSWFWVKP